jgi:hypothetical protein
MPRLKKKYMEKYAQPPVVAAPVVVAPPATDAESMTLRGAAARYGIKLKSVRTLIEKHGIPVTRMAKYGTVRIADMDALRAKLELCDKLNADPYQRTLPNSKRWKWRPRKVTDTVAHPYTPEQIHAETRATEYAITAGIPFTQDPLGILYFLDLRGLMCFPSTNERLMRAL